MTSLEIAELTEKSHSHLMRDIRKMEDGWEKVNGTKFGLVEYRDQKGERRRTSGMPVERPLEVSPSQFP